MKDLEYQEIGRRIETRMKELGLTLADVASKVGVAPSTILRYEKGKFGKFLFLVKRCKVLVTRKKSDNYYRWKTIIKSNSENACIVF